jgi:hypothetical protein
MTLPRSAAISKTRRSASIGSETAEKSGVLRLVLRTQPRSIRIVFGGSVMRPLAVPGGGALGAPRKGVSS